LCGLCGEQLPQDLLFSQKERKKDEEDLEVIKQKEIAEREAKNHQEQKHSWDWLNDPDV